MQKPIANFYRPELDGLRGIAIISVLGFHLEGLVSHGYIGVDVFFVLSGFVVCKSVLSRRLTSKYPLREFYLRRFKRLFPALALMLITFGLAGTFLVPPNEFQDMALAASSSALGLSNWILHIQSADYFGIGGKLNLFTHTWSLGIEEQFYLLAAPLLIAITDLRRLRMCIVGVTSVSFVIWLILPSGDGFYLTPARLWQLGAGVLLALSPVALPARLSPLFSALGALAIVSACLIDRLNSLIAVIGTSALIAGMSATSSRDLCRWTLSLSPINYIGRLSYSLYLWHWPCIVIARWTIGMNTPWTQAWVVITALLISSLSFHFLEDPIRRSRWNPFHKKRSAIHATGVLLAPAILVATFPVAAALTAKFVSSDGFIPLAFAGLPPSNDWGNAGKHCHHRYDKRREDEFIQGCLSKHPGERTLFLIGDSHAIQLAFAFKDAIYSRSTPIHEFRVIHNGGITEIIDDKELPAELQYLLTHAEIGDVVAVTFFRGKISGRHMVTEAQDPIGATSSAVAVRMRNIEMVLGDFAEALSDRGVSLLLILDGPRLALNVRATSCLIGERLTGHDPCSVTRNASLHDRRPMEQAFEAIAQKHDNVRIWDYHDTLCPETCGARMTDGTLLMIDHNHISRAASLLLGDSLSKVLKQHY